MAKIPCSGCRCLHLIPGQGTKVLLVATKTQCSQINKYFKNSSKLDVYLITCQRKLIVINLLERLVGVVTKKF